MKKLLRGLLCTAALALSLATAAFAAGDQLLISPNPNVLPERQGDFYVLVNGEFVTFPDAVPKIRDDRSFLPFVAVFEQLGFAQEDMTWDGETKTVTATKGDVSYIPFNGGEPRLGAMTVQLTIGDRVATLAYSGDTTANPHGHIVPVVYGYDFDVAPYIDPATSRTYVPFGLVAEMLGYNVGWDADHKAVLIDDVEVIFENPDDLLSQNTETYQWMDKYLDFARPLRWDATHSVGDITVSVRDVDWVEEAITETELSFQGTFDRTDASYAREMDIDAHMSLTVTSPDAQPALCQTNSELTMTVLTDLHNGAEYTYAPALARLLGVTEEAETWYQQSAKPLFPGLGTSYAAVLTSRADTMAELLPTMLHEFKPTSLDYTTKNYLDTLNSLFADSAFVPMDSRMASVGYPGSLILQLDETGSRVVGYEFTLRTPSSTLYYTQDGRNFHYSASTESFPDGNFFAGVGTGSFRSVQLVLTGSISPTDRIINPQPPAGAVIGDMAKLTEK